jgi:hypothetical protein
MEGVPLFNEQFTTNITFAIAGFLGTIPSPLQIMPPVLSLLTVGSDIYQTVTFH